MQQCGYGGSKLGTDRKMALQAFMQKMKSRLDTKASFKGKLDTYRFCDNVSVPQRLVRMALLAFLLRSAGG